jgi:hypothetical protein
MLFGMRITMESTSALVDWVTVGAARVWTGRTARGIAVQCYITRLVACDPRDHEALARELLESGHASSLGVQAIDGEP